MKYAVIDISSSNISMIVAEVNDRITEILFRDRASLTLLHYLEGRKLSARGIDKVVEAVSAMKDKCVSLGADVLYVISTAALRLVENFEEVGAAVLNRAGVPINAVDGQKEALCDYIANRFYSAYERAVLVDIGGASVEICDLSKDSAADRCSLDFGIHTLHRKFVEKIQPEEEEAKRIKKYIGRKLDKAQLPGKDSFVTVVLCGTVTLALYDIYSEFAGAKTEPSERAMNGKKFKKLVKHLVSGRDRSKLILEVAPEKLYSVGIAAIIARTVARRFGAENILVSDRGVKEGYLQLVLDGREQGSYYDFSKEESVIVPQAQEAQADRKKGAQAPSHGREGGEKKAPAGKKTAAKRPAGKRAGEAKAPTKGRSQNKPQA